MSPAGEGPSMADGNFSYCPSETNGFQNYEGGPVDVNCTHSDRSTPSPPSSSSSASSFDSVELNDWEKLRRILTASAKGFSIGAGIKGGLALFSIFARLKRRKALNSLR